MSLWIQLPKTRRIQKSLDYPCQSDGAYLVPTQLSEGHTHCITRCCLSPLHLRLASGSQLFLRACYLLLVFLIPVVTSGLAYLSSWFRDKVTKSAVANFKAIVSIRRVTCDYETQRSSLCSTILIGCACLRTVDKNLHLIVFRSGGHAVCSGSS